MPFQIETTRQPATELGFLLHKAQRLGKSGAGGSGSCCEPTFGG